MVGRKENVSECSRRMASLIFISSSGLFLLFHVSFTLLHVAIGTLGNEREWESEISPKINREERKKSEHTYVIHSHTNACNAQHLVLRICSTALKSPDHNCSVECLRLMFVYIYNECVSHTIEHGAYERWAHVDTWKVRGTRYFISLYWSQWTHCHTHSHTETHTHAQNREFCANKKKYFNEMNWKEMRKRKKKEQQRRHPSSKKEMTFLFMRL